MHRTNIRHRSGLPVVDPLFALLTRCALSCSTSRRPFWRRIYKQVYSVLNDSYYCIWAEMRRALHVLGLTRDGAVRPHARYNKVQKLTLEVDQLMQDSSSSEALLRQEVLRHVGDFVLRQDVDGVYGADAVLLVKYLLPFHVR